ncbi:MAG TPA: flippase activity-associated protein Agl23, partial [Actinomycetota bacterium]|nr:flippase activity-associated protein Agl23 [Actinomycetota bacterium]
MASRPAQAVDAPEPSTEDPISDRWFWIGALVVFVVAALIRLPELGMNPFHHDEGVNGWFTTTLVRSGSYAYDPANYHGPTLYYFALLSEILFGLTNEAMRLVPVVFGLVTVGAVIGLRPVLGSIPVLVGGLLLALSPGAIYVSRYFIHEALLVAFTMTLVASALLYLRSRNPAWALGVGASAALIFATKETGVITIAVLAIAAVLSGIYVNWRSGGTAGRGARRAPGTSRASKPASKPASNPAKTVRIDGVEYRPVPDRTSRSLLDGVVPGG